MRRIAFFLTLTFSLFSTGCQRDNQIQTYRVSKEPDFSLPRTAPPPKEVTWKVPPGWKEQPPSSMRLGSFLITGTNGQTADMSVIPLSGMAGGDLANINRWRGQIQLDPISESELRRNSEEVTPGGRRMLLINFVSRDPLLENRYKKRLMAAIYTQGERTWFFKLLGEDQTVEEARPAFFRFLSSLRFHEEN